MAADTCYECWLPPLAKELNCFYMELEKLYDHLLEEVVNTGSAYWLDQYEKTLKKIDLDRMREAYSRGRVYIKSMR